MYCGALSGSFDNLQINLILNLIVPSHGLKEGLIRGYMEMYKFLWILVCKGPTVNQAVGIMSFQHKVFSSELLIKLNTYREETDRAVTKANALESAATEANDRAEKMEEKQRHFQKKLNEKVQFYVMNLIKLQEL